MPGFSGRAVLAKPQAVSPKNFKSLMGWWDASKLKLAANTRVSSFTDLSGNGYHLTNPTTLQQPTLKLAVQNGLDCVQFDGVDDWLECTNPAPTVGIDNWTMFVVAKSGGAGSCTPLYIGNGASSGGNGYGVALSCTTDTTKIGLLRGGSAWDLGSDIWESKAMLLTGRRYNGGFKLWKGGGGTSLEHSLAPLAPSAKVGMGGRFQLDADLQVLNVYEVCIYNRQLSDGEVDALGRYLGDKWNVPYTEIAAPTIAKPRFLFDANVVSGWNEIANGAEVTNWYDNSGNRNDLVGVGPKLTEGMFNGRDGIDFDGVDDFLNKVSISPSPTNGQWTWMALVAFDSPLTAGIIQLVVDADPSSSRVAQLLRINGTAAESVKTNGTAASDASGSVIQPGLWYLFESWCSATQIEMLANGQTNGVTAVSVAPSNISTTLTVGARGGSTRTSYFKGQIAYAIGWDTAMSASNRSAARKAIAKLYNLTVV